MCVFQDAEGEAEEDGGEAGGVSFCGEGRGVEGS